MRKSLEQLKAERIIYEMIKNNPTNPKQVLEEATKMADNFRFSISRRVTTAIWIMTLHDFYEDMTKERLKELHDQYLLYFESFDKGNENIFKQLLEVNEMLDGELLDAEVFDIVENLGR